MQVQKASTRAGTDRNGQTVLLESTTRRLMQQGGALTLPGHGKIRYSTTVLAVIEAKNQLQRGAYHKNEKPHHVAFTSSVEVSSKLVEGS